MKLKGPPSPVTGFPMATQFQKTNAMERHSYSTLKNSTLPCLIIIAHVYLLLYFSSCIASCLSSVIPEWQ